MFMSTCLVYIEFTFPSFLQVTGIIPFLKELTI